MNHSNPGNMLLFSFARVSLWGKKSFYRAGVYRAGAHAYSSICVSGWLVPLSLLLPGQQAIKVGDCCYSGFLGKGQFRWRTGEYNFFCKLLAGTYVQTQMSEQF